MINATYTLRNAKTGNHVTFRVSTWAKAGERIVSRCIGHDQYLAIGFLKADGRLVTWKKFRGGEHERVAAFFVRAMAQTIAGRPVEGLEIRIADKCCARCNKALTTPASLDTGFGPVCAARIGIPHTTHAKLTPAQFAVALRDTMAQIKGQDEPDGDDDGPREGVSSPQSVDSSPDDLRGALDYFAAKEANYAAQGRERAIEAKRQQRQAVSNWGGGKAVAEAVYAPLVAKSERDPLETLTRMADRHESYLDGIFGIEPEFTPEQEAKHVELCGVWNG